MAAAVLEFSRRLGVSLSRCGGCPYQITDRVSSSRQGDQELKCLAGTMHSHSDNRVTIQTIDDKLGPLTLSLTVRLLDEMM